MLYILWINIRHTLKAHRKLKNLTDIYVSGAQRVKIKVILSFSFSYPYPCKWGRYNMFLPCCDKDSAIIFTTGRLTSTLLETGVANDCKCNRDQQLNVASEARDNKFYHPSSDWPLRTLLSFRDRTPSTLSAWPSSSSTKTKLIFFYLYFVLLMVWHLFSSFL
jgi:hypothetical protein